MSARIQHAGVDEIEAALDGGAHVRLALVERECDDPVILKLMSRLEGLGVQVRRGSANDLLRMSVRRPAPPILAMSGPDPGEGATEWLRRPGPAWLLTGVRFPGNAGFAIRTAEVSGACGIFVDGEFDGRERRRALRASMYADRFMPVEFTDAETAVALAREAGRRIVAIEDTGDRAPWAVDLSTPALLVVGGEDSGVPQAVLDGCDAVLRLPMEGFIPAYNLQAAMASVALESLRQAGHGAKGQESGGER